MTTKLLGAAQTSAGFMRTSCARRSRSNFDEKSGPTEDDNKTSKGPVPAPYRSQRPSRELLPG